MRKRAILSLAVMKMFFRQREAIIWTFLLPLFIIVLFSFVRFDGVGRLHLGVANEAGESSARLLDSLRSVHVFEMFEGTRSGELEELHKGERDIVLVIPAGSDSAVAGGPILFADVEAKPREVQIATLVIQRILDEQTLARMPGVARPLVRSQAVVTRNLRYIDFLIPGVLSMSIMQMGIFGVAFSFVSLKKRGILRRLWVTPIRPGDFIISQVLVRLFVLVLQMGVLIGVGVLFLDLHFVGSLFLMFALGVLGATVFLSIGFALAGIAKSEDQVAPLANIITLPMMLLSGIFFSRSNLPGLVRSITDFFPLTYLADGLRAVAIDGATAAQVLPEVMGLAVWGVLLVYVAGRAFRWE